MGEFNRYCLLLGGSQRWYSAIDALGCAGATLVSVLLVMPMCRIQIYAGINFRRTFLFKQK